MQRYFIVTTFLIAMGSQVARADITYGRQVGDTKTPNYTVIQGSAPIRVRSLSTPRQSANTNVSSHNGKVVTRSKKASASVTIQKRTTRHSLSTSDASQDGFYQGDSDGIVIISAPISDGQEGRHRKEKDRDQDRDRDQGRDRNSEPRPSQTIRRPHVSHEDLFANCDSVLHDLIQRMIEASSEANKGDLNLASEILYRAYGDDSNHIIQGRPVTTAALKLAGRLSRDFVSEIENAARMQQSDRDFSAFYSDFGATKYNFMIKLMELVTTVNQAERSSMIDSALMRVMGSDVLTDYQAARRFMVNDDVHLLMAQKFTQEIATFFNSAPERKSMWQAVEDLNAIANMARYNKRLDGFELANTVRQVDRQISNVMRNLVNSGDFGG